jgi:hypothetical protein
MKFMLAMVSTIRKTMISIYWRFRHDISKSLAVQKKIHGVTDKCAFANRILQVSIEAACVILKELFVELIYFQFVYYKSKYEPIK